MDKKIREYQTPQGGVHTLYYKVGYNQYYFKRNKGYPHRLLDGVFTSPREAEKAWQAYVKGPMKYLRTSKKVSDWGEKEDPDFKLLKPTKEFDTE